jgi:hypothetical protein
VTNRGGPARRPEYVDGQAVPRAGEAMSLAFKIHAVVRPACQLQTCNRSSIRKNDGRARLIMTQPCRRRRHGEAPEPSYLRTISLNVVFMAQAARSSLRPEQARRGAAVRATRPPSPRPSGQIIPRSALPMNHAIQSNQELPIFPSPFSGRVRRSHKKRPWMVKTHEPGPCSEFVRSARLSLPTSAGLERFSTLAFVRFLNKSSM